MSNKVAGKYIPHNVYDVGLDGGEIGKSSNKQTPFVRFNGEILNETMQVRGMTGSPTYDVASAKIGLDVYITPKTIENINNTLGVLGIPGIPVPFMSTDPEVANAGGIIMHALANRVIKVEITGSEQRKFEQDVPMPDGTIARLPRYNEDGTSMQMWSNRINSNSIIGYSAVMKLQAPEEIAAE